MLYLIEITPPMMRRSRPTRFYLGYCADGKLEKRLAQHRAGKGAALTRAAIEQGSTLTVVWTSPGDRGKERNLKSRRHHHRLLARK